MASLVKGISFNRSALQGRVAEDPQISDGAAFFRLKTLILEQGANKQFTEAIQEVPCLALDNNKIKTVSTYVKKGKQLYIEGYYKTWMDGKNVEQHAFIITLISLGPDENFSAEGKPGGGYNKNAAFPGLPGR